MRELRACVLNTRRRHARIMAEIHSHPNFGKRADSAYHVTRQVVDISATGRGAEARQNSFSKEAVGRSPATSLLVIL